LASSYVPDEQDGNETIIDVQSNQRLGAIALGGEAGNTQYGGIRLEAGPFPSSGVRQTPQAASERAYIRTASSRYWAEWRVCGAGNGSAWKGF